jgi:2,3-bisphosphoglycerate-dependent phosphoglycerate mutase
VDILFIRHGQSLNNQHHEATGGGHNRYPDPPLTDLGRRQAQALARALAAGRLPRPDVLMTSLVRRAAETAAPIAEALDLPLEGHARLHEVGGIFEGEFSGPNNSPALDAVAVPGLTAAELKAISPRLVLPPEATDQGWFHRSPEPPAEAWPRVADLLDELHARFGPGRTVVGLVSHGWLAQGFIRALVGLERETDHELGPWFTLYNTAHFYAQVPPDRHPHRVRLVWTNRHDHLDRADVTE